MISVDNLKVEFNATPLFEDVGFVINRKDRIALVGKNGAGKSTLLKILAGLQTPTEGHVSVPHDCTIGYLPQVMVLSDEHTVMQEAEKAFDDIKQIKARLEEINLRLAERTDYESEAYLQLIEEFTHLNERFNMMGGTNYHAEIERTLQGLGFEHSDFNRPTREFSGGWRMRIELAKLLLRHPDVLLLDEPTNHLDIESIEWLENFLATKANAVMLVSHDRAFLNNVTTRTIEISCRHIYDYKVKYDEFVTLRQERREQQLRAYQNQQKMIQDTTDFIERFRYKATKAVQVQSRIKMLEKVVPIEVDEMDNSTLRLKFTCSDRSGSYPVICDEVGKAFGQHQVFDHVNLTISRGDKVAFVGRNGEGKTTLVRCIMQQINDYTGKLTLGHNIKIGYFAQNQAQLLDENLTVFETIDNVATGDMRLKVRDLLGAFMFGGEDIDKKVKVLSGGERTRLAMIRLLLHRQFEGTVIVVSHDRDFLDGLVQKVYEFGGGKVKEHLGGIYDFLRDKHEQLMRQGTEVNVSERGIDALFANKAQKKDVMGEESPKQPKAGALSYAEQKEYNKKLKKAERMVENCEVTISETESAISILEAQMATPEGAADMSLYERHQKLKQALDKAMEEWEVASEELENLKQQ